MRVRMLSAASVLVLLFLPSETCSPLQRPWGPAPQPTWEPWPGPPRPTASPLPHRLCQQPGGEPSAKPRAARAPQQSGRRRDSNPSSLDLTFHLLRQFLAMSRQERLEQKALSNRLLLQSIGK
ncbi:corticoliberin-like [Neopsephotus bourkii]|uniref:corticoliberin-like n=1 Tax=Neopsephotus bourkii TaxID=309878 RepID=UPI002AA50626|nr:corticoliberin-like [Neopsephotus bourkii]